MGKNIFLHKAMSFLFCWLGLLFLFPLVLLRHDWNIYKGGAREGNGWKHLENSFYVEVVIEYCPVLTFGQVSIVVVMLLL